MDIYAPKGTKVKCTTLSAGYEIEQFKTKQYLEIGKEYTVEKTIVDRYRTEVYLQEFPDISFNSVFFSSDIIE